MAQGNPVTPILRHADGTAVTAQEAYDAFMNTRVLVVVAKNTYEVIGMEWFDTNSAQDDPTNVGFVRLRYVLMGSSDTVSLAAIKVGDSSLVPK